MSDIVLPMDGKDSSCLRFYKRLTEGREKNRIASSFVSCP